MALYPIDIARKGALAYVGAIALTGDEIKKMFDALAKRGTEVEALTRKRLAAVEKITREQFAKMSRPFRAEVKQDVAEVQAHVEETSDAFQKGRARLLDALNLPTHDDILKLNLEIERLGAEIEQLRKQPRRPKAEVAANGAAPLPGYEKMNVETVIDRLPGLDEPTLLAVRAYEQQHANRITVLRAVERTLLARLAARNALGEPSSYTSVEPLPRYGELTVEEVAERLNGLDTPELLHVKVYEQEHGERVTVLRAVEERLAAKQAE